MSLDSIMGHKFRSFLTILGIVVGVMTAIVRAMPVFRELRSVTSTGSLEEAGYETNFERKARQKGTPVWRADYERLNV